MKFLYGSDSAVLRGIGAAGGFYQGFHCQSLKPFLALSFWHLAWKQLTPVLVLLNSSPRLSHFASPACAFLLCPAGAHAPFQGSLLSLSHLPSPPLFLSLLSSHTMTFLCHYWEGGLLIGPGSLFFYRIPRVLNPTPQSLEPQDLKQQLCEPAPAKATSSVSALKHMPAQLFPCRRVCLPLPL